MVQIKAKPAFLIMTSNRTSISIFFIMTSSKWEGKHTHTKHENNAEGQNAHLARPVAPWPIGPYIHYPRRFRLRQYRKSPCGRSIWGDLDFPSPTSPEPSQSADLNCRALRSGDDGGERRRLFDGAAGLARLPRAHAPALRRRVRQVH